MRKTIFIFLLIFCSCHLLFARSASRVPLVNVVVSPDHADWNYKLGEKPEIHVTVYRFGVPVKKGTILYQVGPELFPAEYKDSLRLNDGAAKFKLATRKTPGFTQVFVSYKDDGHRYRTQIKLAFSPTEIKPTIDNPSDFDKFWASTIQEARRTPLQPKLELLPEYSTHEIAVYKVCLQIGFKHQMYGFLCKPKAPGKYPVLFCPPGAGVKRVEPSLEFAKEGFISLSVEIHGIDPLLPLKDYKEISSALGQYMLLRMDSRENYYYRHVYAGCVRCIDYLCSLPDFDGAHVVVTGGSQGGALSIVTAALSNKVTALAAFYPALCDVSGEYYHRAGGWPHFFRNSKSAIIATPLYLKNLAYFDVVNFARRIKIPGFYSWGYNDHTVPPTSVYAAVNCLTAPHIFVVTPTSEHWRFEESNEKAIHFLKEKAGIISENKK